ncbi:DUF2243 domain-containing protein [Flavobacterium piscis]|uniref:Membrane protein n=1 Tax=Flavobacterium piscis TaxID=1114874 RepID=A0ABU1Y9Z4_9FLAO|nr:DUF2243 domain-containing protein [Flavobacterium piscis]MDR7211049.1 putative membrane protein [Flavobacterium piscis]
MKKKKSFLILAELSVLVMNPFNYKITNRLNKILFIGLLLFTSNGYCCINCNKELQQAISDSFFTNIFIMFSAFIVLTLIIVALIYLSVRNYNLDSNSDIAASKITSVPLVTAAIVVGIGIGGFADGIVLHQILQWHEMLSNKFPPDTVLQKSVNMFWDGIFHLFTLLSTIVGIYVLWKVLRKINTNTSGYLLTGGMLAGWGVFNLVEGIINHQTLEMHNVRELTTNKELWNYGFLFFGILLLLFGWLIIRKEYLSSGYNVEIK